MAAWVMPSSVAALVKLPWRAAASKARMAPKGGSLDILSGMGTPIRPVDALPLTIALSKRPVEIRFGSPASTGFGLAEKRGRRKDNGKGHRFPLQFRLRPPAVGRWIPVEPP